MNDTELLREATHAIDAMGPTAVHEVKMQFASFILRPYSEIFEPGKPDSNFESSRRRFSWLKRTFMDYAEKRYEQIFPDSWQML